MSFVRKTFLNESTPGTNFILFLFFFILDNFTLCLNFFSINKSIPEIFVHLFLIKLSCYYVTAGKYRLAKPNKNQIIITFLQNIIIGSLEKYNKGRNVKCEREP